MENELLAFIQLIDTRLERAGIAYMLTGSVAMTFYGVPRMTRDVDLVVECDGAGLDRIVELFSQDCYVDKAEAEEALRSQSMFNIIHNDWLLKADLILRKSGTFRALEFSRRRRAPLNKGEFWVVSPEDLILSKLDWSKATESEMQRRDVAGLLRHAPELDWEYLEKWAEALGVRDALAKARQQMSARLTATERRYEEMLMALSSGERLAMAADMLASARELIIAGMAPDEAADPRLVRRRLFLAFYGDEMEPARRDRILKFIDSYRADQ